MTKRFKNISLFQIAAAISFATVLHAQPHTPAITNYAGAPVNYIRTWDATAPLTDPNTLDSKPLRDVKMATQYLDGLGRPLQTVIRKGSLQTDPNNPSSSASATDLVSPVEYDEYGREQFKWMPYAEATENTGAFKLSPFTPQVNFYYDPNGVLKGQGENFYYSQTVFEPSPLNRVQESFAPGVSWAGTALEALESNRHSGKVKYWLNTITDDVKMWTVTDVPNSFGTYAVSIANNSPAGVYPAGELYKNVSVDEQGKQVQEFKDKEGKVILKKVQLTAVADDGTGKNYNGWLCTYYIYDDLGNLRCVIQPEAVKQMATPNNWNLTAYLDEQCFRYEYDHRNRMILKKVPGAAPVYMVYDQRDRLVMTQDGNMRTGSPSTWKWLVTLYDDLNRPIQTGLWTNGSSLQTHADAAKNSAYYYYPFTTTPTDGTWEKLSSTHYDNYTGLPAPLNNSFNTSWNSFFSTTSNSNYPYYQALNVTTNLTGLTTWTETKVLGSSSQFITTVMLYDEKGRPIQVKSINATAGEDVVTTQYSWAGQPLTTVQKTEKAGANAQTTVVVTQMSYDDLGRVTKVEKRQSHTQVPVNGVMNAMSNYKTLVSNEYDKLGRLKTKKLAPAYNGNTGLESLTYDYNIRGWMLGANREYAKDMPTNNYFGFDLGYDKANNGIIGISTYSNPQYNGNIEGMVWKSKGDGEKRKYDFVYDAANRLLKADFTQYTGGSFNQTAGVNYNVKMGDGSDPLSAYDANGNILQMQQWGLKLNTSVQIDNLKYTYIDGTNKLKSVTDFLNDASTKLGDFKTNTTHPQSTAKAALTASSTPAQFGAVTDYSYDVNGNMNLDNNKGITSITYNYLNLPQTITLLPPPNSTNGSRSITYTYDATGNKLKKETYESMGPGANKKITTTYLNGQVYESKLTNQGGSPDPDDYTDVLQFIGHEEGRIRFKPATAAATASLQYDYMLKDHLGNVRMVLTEEQEQYKYPIASLEDAKLATEQLYYDINTAYIRNTLTSPVSGLPTYTNGDNGIGNNPADAAFEQTNSQKLYRINGNENKTGLGITLKVMAGDKIDIFGRSYYSQAVTNNGTCTGCALTAANLVAAFLNAPGAIATTGVHGAVTPALLESQAGGSITSILQSSQNTQAQNNTNRPRAFINYILFDEQFKYAGGGASMVGDAYSFKQHFSDLQDISIPKNGYIYVYCSNESNINVFFDNLQVVHSKGAILEETHYYPFGLTMGGISSKSAGSLVNKYKFNSYETNTDFDLNIGEAFFRTHDAQLGRWWLIDPKAIDIESPYSFGHNNPILFNDALGDTSELYDMNGNYLNTINNKGALTRMMVDGDTYNTMYGNDTYKDADWDDQKTANGFMSGLEAKLKDMEKSTGNDYIAKETGLSISFKGDATDANAGSSSDPKIRQQGTGKLSINAVFDNGKSASIADFPVVSGPGGNGVLPDGKYTTGKPYFTGKGVAYTDKQGTFFKIPLIPDKSVGIPSQAQGGRYALLIHPTGMGINKPFTEGCIGITRGAANFFQMVGGKNMPRLNVTVNVTGNANTRTDLKNKAHY